MERFSGPTLNGVLVVVPQAKLSSHSQESRLPCGQSNQWQSMDGKREYGNAD